MPDMKMDLRAIKVNEFSTKEIEGLQLSGYKLLSVVTFLVVGRIEEVAPDQDEAGAAPAPAPTDASSVATPATDAPAPSPADVPPAASPEPAPSAPAPADAASAQPEPDPVPPPEVAPADVSQPLLDPSAETSGQ